MTITDRTRITVIQVNTNEILSRDLVVKELQVIRNLSSAAMISFSIPMGEQSASAYGIDFKQWGQWLIPETEINNSWYFIWSAFLVNRVAVDPASGDLKIEGVGFMGYPKGIPWLENFNPIAVDPAEVIQRIWSHVQSYNNANLGVEVYPATTGTQMLPGFGFDGNILSFDFFAIFVRAVDFNDSGDFITSLSRDLPLDLFEQVTWNADRTEVGKTLQIAYPVGGLQQVNLAFKLGENVITAEKADELEIEPVSDIIIRGWLPGKVYTSQLSNADMTRARRVAMEEDVHIDSTERAAAWAHRKLTRRNIPKSFEKITIDHSHPNAPFGSFDVGDSIYITAPAYPWYGDISGWHRITSINYKDGEPTMELSVKVDGAFNYDPIEYDPDAGEKPKEDYNRLSNGYFRSNLAGWSAKQGQWFRVTDIGYDIADIGYSDIGSVRVDCDDGGERFLSHRVHVTPGEALDIMGAVKWQEVTSGPTDRFYLRGFGYLDGGFVDNYDFAGYVNPTGAHQFYPMKTENWIVPENINELAVQLTVTSGVTHGATWWSSIRIVSHGL